MECPQARYKIEEAEYFLQRIKEVYNDTRLIDFYLNAFLISARSIIEYVRSDFFTVLNPQITSQMWKKDREKRDEMVKQHPQKNLIENFLKDNKNAYNSLKRDPMMYYFLEKRNTIVHHRYAGAMGGSYTGSNSGNIFHVRYLETQWAEEYLQKNPNLRIDLGDIQLSDEERTAFEDKLRREDMMQYLKYFVDEIKKFVQQFENINYLNPES